MVLGYTPPRQPLAMPGAEEQQEDGEEEAAEQEHMAESSAYAGYNHRVLPVPGADGSVAACGPAARSGIVTLRGGVELVAALSSAMEALLLTDPSVHVAGEAARRHVAHLATRAAVKEAAPLVKWLPYVQVMVGFGPASVPPPGDVSGDIVCHSLTETPSPSESSRPPSRAFTKGARRSPRAAAVAAVATRSSRAPSRASSALSMRVPTL